MAHRPGYWFVQKQKWWSFNNGLAGWDTGNNQGNNLLSKWH